MRDLLDHLWPRDPNLFGELRIFRDRERAQFFFPLSDAGMTDAFATVGASDAAGADVYFGVVPRIRRGGTAADTDCIVHALWADIDAKNVGGKDAALHSTLRLLSTPPSAVVDSGHGYHAYWFLGQPEGYTAAVPYLKGLAREVNGDHVHDRARILRVPGTHNRKDPSNPLPVRLLFLDATRRYDLTDLPMQEERTPRSRDYWYGQAAPKELPSWLSDLIEQPTPKGARSEAVFRAIVWMMRFGMSEHDIRLAIMGHPKGIGEKFYDKGTDGERWLDRTLGAARVSL